MKINNRHLSITAMAAVFALSACGGGGDSGTTTPTNPDDGSTGGGTTTPALTVAVTSALPAAIAEGGEGQYVLTVTGAQNGFSVKTAPTVNGGVATVQHAIKDDKVTVTIIVGDVDYATSTFTNVVTITDGKNRQVQQASKTALKDTTAAPVITKITGSAAKIKSFAERAQTLSLVNKLSEIAMVMGETVYSDYGKEFQSAVNSSTAKASLLAWSTHGPNLVSAYNAGQVSEMALSDAMTDILVKAQQHSQAGSQVLAEVISIASWATGNFAVTGVYLNPMDYSLSMFEGNPNLGSYQDGVWKYAAPVSFLAAIVGTDVNMCSVN
ncbi:hypothetical protein FJD32_004310 [Shewanella sp. LC6]|uniref:hypothetical protein n=1 Tax=unclassified Shewanella TaxID=196818 RepID=UPI00112D6558|nr:MULTISPECIES: hypothetical protein [unclassified Shewanella]QQK58800.1 hypothetical protein FJD32_004310 [Shewanella sp. LC6]TPE50635.1 hypothetical protein FJD33_20020 [Shewanella sp. LC2]